MVYPLGITTAEGIASALTYAFQIYKEVRLAGQKYDAAKEIMKSIDLTLCSLEGLPSSGSLTDDALSQINVARQAWIALEEYLGKYNTILGTQRRASLPSKIPKTLKWACNELDNRVELLHSRINTCIVAILPMLVISNNELLQQLSVDVAELKLTLASSYASTPEASSSAGDQDKNETSDTSTSADTTIDLLCWRKRGGCGCRCHSARRLDLQRSQHLFIDVFGLPALFQACDVQKCTRRDGVELRMAASRYGIPFAFLLSIAFQSSWLPRLSLTTERVCKYTSPGFRALEELQQGYLLPFDEHPVRDWSHWRARYDIAVRQKVADIQRLFADRQISFSDVDPAGKGWLEKVLRMPWGLATREAQWDLVEFLVSRSPEQVRANPKLLYRCAKWIGEGPHMAMLKTLLNLKIDPGDLDSSLFHREWPRSCDLSWQSEALTEDPMFVQFVSECVRKAQGVGFAGCDDLTESCLADSESEFKQVLDYEIKTGAVLRSKANALGQTALHLAILKPARLERLLQAGMDPDAVDRGGSTPLMYAACYGQLDSVLCLLRYGANPRLVDSRNRRLFIDYAIRRRHIHVIEGLVSALRSKGQNTNAMAVLDRSVCYYFGSGCHVSDLYGKTLKRLFDLGADPDILNGTSTMLHHATSDLEGRMILDAGFTRVNSRDNEGVTPLMKVAARFDLRSTKELIVRGAAVKTQDNLGWTTLHHLMHAWHSIDIVGTIRENDEQHVASSVEALACIHHIIRSGALVGCRDYCKCACSSQGCTTVTIALHEIANEVRTPYSSQRISGIPVDLLCILLNRNISSLSVFVSDVKRYRNFMESGLEHTCCFRKINSYLCLDDSLQEYDDEHAALSAGLDIDTGQPENVRTEAIGELAEFFTLLEARSLKQYEDALLHTNKKSDAPRPRLEVDEAKDTFRIQYDINILPQFSQLDIAAQKSWLSNVGRIEKNGGFHQRGTVQAHLEECLKTWNELEIAMQALRPNVTD